jgi:hypothetical protein
MLNFSVGFHQDVATVNFHLVQQALKASGSPKPPDKRLRFGPVSVWNRAQPARLRTAEMAAVLLRLPASWPAPVTSGFGALKPLSQLGRYQSAGAILQMQAGGKPRSGSISWAGFSLRPAV